MTGSRAGAAGTPPNGPGGRVASRVWIYDPAAHTVHASDVIEQTMNSIQIGIVVRLAHCCLVLLWASVPPTQTPTQSAVSQTPAQQSNPTEKPQAATAKDRS